MKRTVNDKLLAFVTLTILLCLIFFPLVTSQQYNRIGPIHGPRDGYTLTLTTSGTGTGAIEANSTGPFYSGSTVTIWANASIGSTFTGFTGNLTGTTTPQVLIFDGNETVDASFTRNGPYTIMLTTSGTGTGTIQTTPGPYYYGDFITIWANASIGSTFTGFSGSLTGTTTPQTLIVDGNETVDAAFTLNGPFTLTLSTSGIGAGVIQASPGPYYYGSTAAIWANASIGSTFMGFTGSLLGTTTPQILIFDGNETIDAQFSLNGPYTLTLTTSGTGNGTIEAYPLGPYLYGSVVSISATANIGSSFTGFTGNLTGTIKPQNLIMTGDKAVNAEFSLNMYTLTFTTNGTGTGTIQATPGPYYYGSSVTIWANASIGSTFAGFTGGLTGSNTPQTLTVDGNEVINAEFIQNIYTLTLTTNGTGIGTIQATPGPYYYGATVTIWANASIGSHFTGFTGNLTGSTTPQILIIDGNKTVDAQFTLNGPYTLTLTTSGTGTGTLQANPPGPYYHGTIVTIWANASTGSTFNGFTGSLSGTTTPQTLIVDGNKTIDAQFTLNGPYTLTLTTSGTGTGTLQANPAGPYYYGSMVTIWANVSLGSTFDGFTGNLTGATTPQTLLMDGNKTVNAQFTLNGPYTLTLTSNGTGTGTIAANPPGPYYYGAIVNITATANTGSTFKGFSGDLTGTTTPQTIIMNGNKTVNAEFTLNMYTLTLTTSGTGSGIIQATPGPYYHGSSVIIWAYPSTGSTFSGFSGDLTGLTTPQTLLMNSNKTVNAQFTLNGPYTLTLATSGAGSGTIQASPAGPHYYGNTVTIWANASIGSSFTGFTGSLSGITTPQTLFFDGDETVIARFTLNNYTLSLTTNGTGSGTIQARPAGPYQYGTLVTIWANASNGSTFTGFSGSLTGTTTPQTLSIAGNETVNAEFTLNGPFTLTLTTSGSGSGTIQANPPGPYYYGSTATIWANASIGSHFTGFTGSLSGPTTPQTFTFNGNEVVNAQFSLNGPYNLTLTTNGTGVGTIDAYPLGPYLYGSIVRISAIQAIGSSFTGFSGDLNGTTTPQNLSMTGDKTVNAEFRLNGPYTLTLTTSGNGTGSIQATPGPYNYGSSVTIWANASIGSMFTGFSGNLIGTTTPQILIMDGNKTVNAEYIRKTYTLTLIRSGTGLGSIQASPGPYYYGSTATIWANASIGSHFTGFTGNLTGSTTPQIFIFDGNKTVDAQFTLNGPYSLTLTTNGTGTGTIQASPGPFFYGTPVTIWANASIGSTFNGFTGNLTGTTTPQILFMDGNKTVNAQFTLNGPYTLTLTTNGSGIGTIQANSPGPFYYGSMVTIWANASIGSTFTGFSGSLTGTTTPQILFVDGDETVNAQFTLNGPYTLTLTTTGTGSGTITADRPGPYYYGAIVNITATANTGSIFTGFSGDLTGTTTPQTIIINGHKAVNAEFTLKVYTLTLTTNGTGSGIIQATPGPYTHGSSVIIWAYPSTGSTFSGFSGDLTGLTTPQTLLMNSNKTVNAQFTLNGPYTLTLATSGAGSGTIQASPAGPHYYGNTVTIWANASIGSSFTGFTGSLSGTTTPQMLIFDGDETVVAHFTLNNYTLSLTTSGTGTGTIKARPAVGPYHYGALVTIWANASNGSTFTGFSGSLTGTTTPQTLSIDGNETVDAQFTQNNYTLLLTTNGTGSGTIQARPAGPYQYGDLVTIWANTSYGSIFAGFSGSLMGTTTPQTLFINGNVAVNAEFILDTYTLTLSTNGTGAGTLQATPGPYNYGSSVTIWANASIGSTFMRFSGGLTGPITPQNLLMDGNKTVNAQFNLNGPYTLTLTTSGTGTGTIQANPAGPYYYGSTATIWANVSIGSHFTGFTGSLSGNITPQILTFDENLTVDASFTRNGPYTLTLTSSGNGTGTIAASPIGPYYYGDVVTIFANASIGSHFTGFTGNLTGIITPQTLMMNSNKAVDAQFTHNGPYSITLTTSGNGTGTIQATPGPYYYGSMVTIWANASIGSHFTGFTGSLTGNTTPQILFVDGNETINAQFTRTIYSLTLTTNGTGTGTIQVNFTGPYYYGTRVKIWANTSFGSRFTGFYGSLSGTITPQNLTFDGNEAVTAQFTRITLTLTLTTNGTGSGTIQVNSTGPYYYGTRVKIWANASIGSIFRCFFGSLQGIITPQNLTFDGNESVTAHFTLKGPYTLMLTTSGSGNGTIQVNSTGPYYYGTRVKIWANASSGSTFIGFSGSLNGTTTPQNLTFNGNEAVNANFTMNGPFTVTLTTSGNGSGTLEASPAGPYYYGAMVTIYANASTGSIFLGFSGDLTGTTTPQTLFINGNKAINAEFIRVCLLNIHIQGSGTVRKEPNQSYYGFGQVVTLTALPNAWWVFDHWDGDLSGNMTPITITMDTTKSVVAVFTCYNHIPLTPERPTGETNGATGVYYNYTTMTTDPDGDQIYYQFSWGDGGISEWDGPYDSGEEITKSHNWTWKGIYSITVRAKDIYGAESDWSTPLRVKMPKETGYSLLNLIQQFLEKLFERFPNAFPILRTLLNYPQV